LDMGFCIKQQATPHYWYSLEMRSHQNLTPSKSTKLALQDSHVIEGIIETVQHTAHCWYALTHLRWTSFRLRQSSKKPFKAPMSTSFHSQQ